MPGFIAVLFSDFGVVRVTLWAFVAEKLRVVEFEDQLCDESDDHDQHRLGKRVKQPLVLLELRAREVLLALTLSLPSQLHE